MSKRIYVTFALCLTCLSALVACAGADNTNGTNMSNANANRAAATPVSAATPAATVATASGDKIGVAECDDYFAKVDACVNSKVPEAARAQYKASMETNRKMWREQAANPQARAALATGCKQALESARAAYKSFGCTF